MAASGAWVGTIGAGGGIWAAVRAELRRPGFSGGRTGNPFDGSGSALGANTGLFVAPFLAGATAVAATAGFVNGRGDAALLGDRASGIFFNGTFEAGEAATFDGGTALDVTDFLIGSAFDTDLAFATGLPPVRDESVFVTGFAAVLEAAPDDAPDDFAGFASAADFFAPITPAEVLTVLADVFVICVDPLTGAFPAVFTTVFAGAFAGFFAVLWLGALAGALDFLTGAFTIGLL